MKADAWGFRIINLLLASSASGVLWWLFAEHVNDLLFLVPLYWIMHVRDQVSRQREINARMKVLGEVVAELLDDPNDPTFQYEATLEKHGFYAEAERWEDRHDEVSRT